MQTPKPWTMDRQLTFNEAHEVGCLLCKASRAQPSVELMQALEILSNAGHAGARSYVESYRKHQRAREHS